jgi:nucleoid-associated protein YgaU
MKIKHLLFILSLFLINIVLNGCMARIDVNIKDVSVGENIKDDINSSKSTSNKTELSQALKDELNKIDWDNKNANKLVGNFKKDIEGDNPYIETEGQCETNYTVKAGDCLWNISQVLYNDPYKWTNIYQANQDKINNPDLIYPGQELIIPR